MQYNLIQYGEVSNELCSNCHKCSDYDLSLGYNYTKFISISFHERNHKYYLRCKNCRAYSEISKPNAQYIVDTKFSENERKRKRKLLIKNVFSALFIGAVIFGIVIGALYNPDMVYKNLVADKPDGFYEIYDKEGKLWARITKEGTMRYDLLVKQEKYEEEGYISSIEEGLYYDNYYSDQDGVLKVIKNNAGTLVDKNGIGVQYYFYDTEEKDIFYNFGVDNFSRISYSENRAVYPMTYYADENEYYCKVFERGEGIEMILLFRDTKGISGGFGSLIKPAKNAPDYSGDRLYTAEIYTLDNGRAVKYEYYDFSEEEELSPALSSLSRQSGLSEVAEALKASGVKPYYTEEDTYYKDTKIVESAVTLYQDASGLQMTDYVYYNIEEKDGWYIVTMVKNKLPEGQQA